MNKNLITLCAEIALKIGPALYNQLADLLGPQIPTWDELARENAALQAEIDKEMK